MKQSYSKSQLAVAAAAALGVAIGLIVVMALDIAPSIPVLPNDNRNVVINLANLWGLCVATGLIGCALSPSFPKMNPASYVLMILILGSVALVIYLLSLEFNGVLTPSYAYAILAVEGIGFPVLFGVLIYNIYNQFVTTTSDSQKVETPET